MQYILKSSDYSKIIIHVGALHECWDIDNNIPISTTIQAIHTIDNTHSKQAIKVR